MNGNSNASCGSFTSSQLTSPSYTKSGTTFSSSTSSTYEYNLFDLSSSIFDCVTGSTSANGDACTSSTPGITVRNGDYTARWMDVLVDVTLACGDIAMVFTCALQGS